MNRSVSMLLVVLASLTLASPPPARAQSEVPTQPKAEPPQLIELEFPGGTIAEYVEALNEVVGKANIVVMAAARDIEMPPIELNSVALGSALELIQGEFQPQERVRVQVHVDEVSMYEEGEKPIHRVFAEVHRQGRPSETSVHVWTVANLLSENLPPDAVLTAVETAVELVTDLRQPAEIRFHEATGLIIARGSRQQLEAVDYVVRQVEEGIERRRAASREAQEMPSEARARITVLEEEVRQRSRETEMLKLRVQETGRERDRLEATMEQVREENRRLEAMLRRIDEGG